MRFEGKTALVTGAASGIGRATAVQLAREGAHVCCADVQDEALEETVKSIEQSGGRAFALRCDVGDESSVDDMMRGAVEQLGRLDVLCNIAGILRFDHTHELSLEDWNRILTVNLTGTFLVTRTALPHLVDAQGVIVNMASTAGLSGSPWTAAYSASKGGVIAFSATLAVEYGKQGVRVNTVCPGGIETPIHASFHIPEGADPKLLRRTMPFRGMEKPEAVADVIAFLASNEARHIHGVALAIDGGTLMSL
jgi:meso-butanediol dehydrogenase/(S,S)-butanediol dehydrogenase/diacetyl reductase